MQKITHAQATDSDVFGRKTSPSAAEAAFLTTSATTRLKPCP
ncbi:hypothetical protein [Terriglobus albidus]|nr:hypothetical protein [Terriglobus albidus]